MDRHEIARRTGVPSGDRPHNTALRVHCPGAEEALALRAFLNSVKKPTDEHQTAEFLNIYRGALGGVAKILEAMATELEKKCDIPLGELSRHFAYSHKPHAATTPAANPLPAPIFPPAAPATIPKPPPPTPKPSITRLTPARLAALESIHAARRGKKINPPLPAHHRDFLLHRFPSIAAAARGIGVDPKTIARWVSGVKNPSPRHLEKIERLITGGPVQ